MKTGRDLVRLPDMFFFDRLLAIAKMRCPRCHRGRLFVNPNPFNFSQLSKMPAKCECCGQLTEPETGFYYGAMYVSYGLCILISFTNYFVFESGLGFSGKVFLTINTLVLIILWPIIFRYARVLYLYIFVRYNPPNQTKK